MPELEPLTGIGNNSSSMSKNRLSAGGSGTPGALRRQMGNQPTAASPGLRHMPNVLVNRILHKRSPEPFATPSGHKTDGDSISDTSPPDMGPIQTEGAASNSELTAGQVDESGTRPVRTNSFSSARASMLTEIRNKAPKIKLKNHGRRSGNASTLSMPSQNARERSNSFSSADNLSMKSGTSGEILTGDVVNSGVGGSDDPMSSLAGQVGMPGDETDYHERVQQQIKQYEEKLRQAKQELQDFQRAYVDDLSRENSVESHASEKVGASLTRKNHFEAYNKRYKSDEQKLQDKVCKYEEKLQRIKMMEKASPGDNRMMQGVKDHVSSLRRSVKSGLAQAQGGLHVPSFGKIFGSNNNIPDELQAGENSPPRLPIPDNLDWTTHVAEVQEVQRRTSLLEESAKQMGVQLAEAGDGQDRMEDSMAKLQAEVEQRDAEKKDAETRLSAALDRIGRLEAEMTELATSFDNRAEDTLLRLQNAQLQMAERCQEIDEIVEKCEARVSELEHRGRQALTIATDEGNTNSVIVVVINASIAVLYTILAYWMKVQQLLPPPIAMAIPYVILLMFGVFVAWLLR